MYKEQTFSKTRWEMHTGGPQSSGQNGICRLLYILPLIISYLPLTTLLKHEHQYCFCQMMLIDDEPVHHHPNLSCICNAHGKKYYLLVEVTVADKEVNDDISSSSPFTKRTRFLNSLHNRGHRAIITVFSRISAHPQWNECRLIISS